MTVSSAINKCPTTPLKKLPGYGDNVPRSKDVASANFISVHMPEEKDGWIRIRNPNYKKETMVPSFEGKKASMVVSEDPKYYYYNSIKKETSWVSKNSILWSGEDLTPPPQNSIKKISIKKETEHTHTHNYLLFLYIRVNLGFSIISTSSPSPPSPPTTTSPSISNSGSHNVANTPNKAVNILATPRPSSAVVY